MRNLENFDATFEKLKICTLICSFWPKHLKFGLKMYRGVMHHYTEDWCKLWRKNDLWFHLWRFWGFMRNLMNFTSALKNLKICTLRDVFLQGECLMFNVWETDLWHEELSKFWRNNRKTQNLHFNGLLLIKVYNVWGKNVQRSHASLYWRLMQTLKEKWLVVSFIKILKTHEEFGELHQRTQKS